MFQDIRTPKQSLRDILPRKVAREREVEIEVEAETVAPHPRRSRTRRSRSGLRLFGWVMVLALAAGGGYWASQALARATITVTPQTAELPLNHERVTVPYETVTLGTLQASAPVQTTAGGSVAKKASGKLTIYNNYSSTAQALIANTRFEAPNGKIYRLNSRVTVPGKKADGTPGSIQVAVTADQPGSGYNLTTESGQFTLPGFKGEPQAGKIYAKLAGALAGGSTGEERVIAESDRVRVLAELKPKLLAQAAEQVRFQLPPGYVVYPDSIVLDYEEKLTATQLTLSAKPSALIFKEADLAKAIVTGRLDQALAAEPLAIANLAALVVAPERQSLDSAKKQAVVAVDGAAKAVLTLDLDRLKTELSGSERASAQEIFAQYPAIARAQVSFLPPWVQRFPSDQKRITINILP